MSSVKSSLKPSVLSVSIWSRVGTGMRAFVASKIVGNDDITDHLTLKVFLEDTLKERMIEISKRQ